MCFAGIKQTVELNSTVIHHNYLIKSITRILAFSIFLGSSALLASCAGTPDAKRSHFFYPPLPAKPRIQYLTSFSGTNLKKSKKSSFSDFVLGKNSVEEQGVITKPYGVGMFDEKLYVVDLRLPGYHVLNFEDQIVKKVTGSGDGRMVKPVNITFDADGSKYITDTQRERILVYDKNDKFLRALGKNKQFKPADVVLTTDLLYVTDLKHHKVHVLDKDTGEALFSFGKAGSKDKDFFFPTNMTMTEDGYLYISDTGNYRVLKYLRGGKKLISQFGKIGSGVGQFARPKGVAVDKKGRMYVVDSAFENVQIFDAQGNVLLFFGEPGNNIGNLNLPVDIAIDYDHVDHFKKYARQGFNIEYLIMVTSQFGPYKVNVYGFGEITNNKLPADEEIDDSKSTTESPADYY